MQYYQMRVTDAYGLYRFEGVAPGRYTLISWWDEAPCEVYHLESLGACRSRGESVEVRAGEEKHVPLTLTRVTEPLFGSVKIKRVSNSTLPGANENGLKASPVPRGARGG